MEGKVYYKDYFKEHRITFKGIENASSRREKILTIQNVMFDRTALFKGIDRVNFINCIFNNVVFSKELNHLSFQQCKFEHSGFRKTCLYRVYFVDCIGNILIDRSSILGCYFEYCSATFDIYHCFGEATIIHACPNIKCPLACPSEGSFIAYKKCCRENDDSLDDNEYVVKLLIPEDAKRSSSIGIKCRASKAVVLDIISLSNKDEKIDVVYSEHCFEKGESFPYKIGETVYPDYFDDDRFEECAGGIHFYMNFEDAAEY